LHNVSRRLQMNDLPLKATDMLPSCAQQGNT